MSKLKETEEKKFLKEAEITLLLITIGDCFESIRGDWTNPKYKCKEGMDATARLTTLLNRS